MDIQIIDYGMGNLKSVRRAIEECGANVLFVTKPEELNPQLKVVLPGVGSYKDGMKNLCDKGFDQTLRNYVNQGQGALLGICLGMQMLSTSGEENGHTKGLNLISGVVRKFEITDPTLRIPHVGWNGVIQTRRSKLFESIPSGADYYFVHSYYLVADQEEDVIGVTDFGTPFCSAVNKGNVYGVQFHPEKSQRYGLQLIRNFLNL